MPEFRTRALVLRTFDQGESDRVVHLYTEQLGRVSAIAKGARRSRRRFPGTLEILTVVDARIVDPPRSSLMRLEGARVNEPFGGLTNDLGRFAIACQLLEILNRFTGEREPNPTLFGFALGVLDVVTRETPDRLLALLVLTKTLARLGYRPELGRCSSCEGPLSEGEEPVGFEPRHGGAVCAACLEPTDGRVQAGLLRAIDLGIRSPLRDRAQLGMGPRQVTQAGHLLERFFRFHVGLELRTDGFLRAVLPVSAPLDAPSGPEDTAPTPADGRGIS